ncbi:MAG: hypothetical protein WDZ59_00485 [Pirellulales bacterium]
MTSRFWRRLLAFAGLLTLVTAVPALGQIETEQEDAASSKVPVRRVVMFSSGVGYFEHLGEVEGDATVDLKFNVDDVNDLLKSMVLRDLGGGRISTVTYGSRDPITKTLETFAIDLTSDPSLGQLLAQIRGERVQIDAPTAIEGTIVGVETKREEVDDQVVEVEYLNLLTDEGLRRIRLDQVGRIKLANPDLDAELRQALQVLAASHATDKKTVTLNFRGEGQREVRVGYIQESPVWKTSYRLVLDDEEAPFLQGWAIVENTSDADWEEVSLSLVSGRPISFVMDLYSPLYADRPVVQPELYSSVRPRTYDQDLAQATREFEEAAQGEQQQGQQRQSLARRARAFNGLAPPAAEPAASAAADALYAMGGGIGGAGGAKLGELLQEGLEVAAQGGDVGELFKYDIEAPVTLARQRSAMLPIINDSLEGEKLSIYNVRVHAKHPLNGVRLKNTSDLHLMQGPMTVFDGGVYAGDAKIPDLPAGGERLLSYAMDLDVEVAPTSKGHPQQLVSVRIEKGVLHTQHKLRRTHSYTVKNSAAKPKDVLLEHPLDTEWTLVSPEEPAEKTRDVYRFAVDAEPGQPAELTIKEERTLHENIAINNLNNDVIQVYLGAEVVSDQVKEALREVVQRKAQLADLVNRKAQIEQEIATISQEQERIRQNMQAIQRNTELYNRYVTKFTEQEDQIEQHREEIRSLEQEINRMQKSLDEYLMSLELM